MVRIAVVGATGAVGQTLLSILEERRFPHDEIRLFASPRSEGRQIPFAGRKHRCRKLEPGCFDGVTLAFFDASDAVSREWVPRAAESGAWVVDNSAAFRMDRDVPLVVPEVNGHELQDRLARAQRLQPRDRIIAGPNCSTAQMVVALMPIHAHWGLKRVVVSTYQSTSGAGSAAMAELSAQTAEALEGPGAVRAGPRAFAHRIAFNCIPHIGGFRPDGYTGEESKMIEESRKILGLPSLRITATAVRVPTFSCHGEFLNVECERALSPDRVREALRGSPGVSVVDEPARNAYPMGACEDGAGVEPASGRDAVYVGRIRRDESVENGVNLWIVSDNLRKGAALNAVQIGEVLVVGLR